MRFIKKKGIEYQQVFDEFLGKIFKKVDYKILSAGIVAYRRAREASLIPYPACIFYTLFFIEVRS
jgi:hypothetical protein